jgi:hypothetical protein
MNCLPSSPQVVGGGQGTAYRVHYGLLVGVVELLPSSLRVIGGGRGYWWGSL